MRRKSFSGFLHVLRAGPCSAIPTHVDIAATQDRVHRRCVPDIHRLSPLGVGKHHVKPTADKRPPAHTIGSAPGGHIRRRPGGIPKRRKPGGIHPGHGHTGGRTARRGAGHTGFGPSGAHGNSVYRYSFSPNSGAGSGFALGFCARGTGAMVVLLRNAWALRSCARRIGAMVASMNGKAQACLRW